MQARLNLPGTLRRTLERELQPGERIRWLAQPVPRLFTTASIGSLLFGIPWTSFALFWMWGASGFRLPDLRQGLPIQHLFALFGVPFVLIGLGMLSSPIWTWRAARGTVYLVTDQRALAIQGGWSTTIRSFRPDQLGEMYRKERSDGTGDLILAIRRWQDSDGDARSEEIGFLGVRGARDAETAVRRLIEDHP